VAREVHRYRTATHCNLRRLASIRFGALSVGDPDTVATKLRPVSQQLGGIELLTQFAPQVADV
jgi:hypothetical protein